MSQDSNTDAEHADYTSGYPSQQFQPPQSAEVPSAPQEYYGTPDNPYGAGDANEVGDIPPFEVPLGTSENATANNTPPFSSQGQSGPYSPPPYGNPQPFQAPPRYGYRPPRTKEPLPLGQAIKALPGQYTRILTKPSAQTFAEELGKSSWDIIWVQLLALSLLTAVFTLLALFIVALIIRNSASDASALTALPGLILSFSPVILIMVLILVPASFFIGTGISYLIAKAFDGKGTFLEQCYTTMLINAPITFLNVLLRLIPFVGSLAAFALGIYSIFLQIYALMAVHRVSGGKAALIYFIPWIALAVLYVIFVALFLFFIFSIPHVRQM